MGAAVSDADDIKSFTSKKLDLQHRVMSDPRVTDGQFRMFCLVLHTVNQHTGIAAIGNKKITDEVPSCSSESTAKANRKKLATLGYWTFKPGTGRIATEYKINWEAGAEVDAMLAVRAEARETERREKDRAWRKHRAGGVVHDPLNEGGGVVHDGVNQAGGRLDTGGGGVESDPQPVMQDTPYTLQTPSTIQEAHDIKVSTRASDLDETPPSERVILATIGEVIDFIDAHPSTPVGRAGEGLSDADLDRGERVITGHIEQASREAGLTIEEATAAIGDELAKMKRAVAEFPGDEGRAVRRIRRLLRDADGARNAA